MVISFAETTLYVEIKQKHTEYDILFYNGNSEKCSFWCMVICDKVHLDVVCLPNQSNENKLYKHTIKHRMINWFMHIIAFQNDKLTGVDRRMY